VFFVVYWYFGSRINLINGVTMPDWTKYLVDGDMPDHLDNMLEVRKEYRKGYTTSEIYHQCVTTFIKDHPEEKAFISDFFPAYVD
jgi:hypothetical protein